MRKILVIGIGAGNPDHLTIAAVQALNRLDVVFLPDKGDEKAALKRARTAICDRHIAPPRSPSFVTIDVPPRDRTPSDYSATVGQWHANIADRWQAAIEHHLTEDDTGGFLVWGDPSLYDSTLRILAAVRARGVAFDLEVIPGITAVQALTAAHATTLNAIGEPVLITTGRRLRDTDLDTAGSVVVMLDGEQAFRRLDDDSEILWGAYVGTADEILVAGRLGDVKDEIATRRAAARERHGWIMDTYLVRRRSDT